MTHEKTGTNPKGAGRPTDYKPEYAKQAYKLCLLSAINKDLADFFGVTEMTIHNWKNEHPEFAKALKDGKVDADANVAARLYNRAVGYSHEQEEVFYNQKLDKIVTKKVIRHYPPDSWAAWKWLISRRPNEWSEKRQIEGMIKNEHRFPELTAKEVKNLKKAFDEDF